MPELPEVETIKRGILPHVPGEIVSSVIVRQPSLRWLVPSDLPDTLSGKKFLSVERRAKYLLLKTDTGTVIIHLGMSGSLRLLSKSSRVTKHDHIDICFESGKLLRFNDPRRFGAVLWTKESIEEHKLLCHLGPEPLSDLFSETWLFQKSRGRRQSVKTFIMNNTIVVGVGNIYAAEALFSSGIRPDRPVNKISQSEFTRLTGNIKKVLARAIDCGGTTLKDFTDSDGKPGYFAIELSVYGREGKPCPVCGTSVQQIKLGQRASCFCPQCQH